eukprot:TRINITY_DN7341_c0_g1_i9.p2 TRINITY_DN7341_c0_g1~~TRINITY_DN7341_c0_g1_i9.p2  ORF type:complete len:207 (+),score=19.03 TRINITY_DN7341_c0_g1_i9:1182-1802(+)
MPLLFWLFWRKNQLGKRFFVLKFKRFFVLKFGYLFFVLSSMKMTEQQNQQTIVWQLILSLKFFLFLQGLCRGLVHPCATNFLQHRWWGIRSPPPSDLRIHSGADAGFQTHPPKLSADQTLMQLLCQLIFYMTDTLENLKKPALYRIVKSTSSKSSYTTFNSGNDNTTSAATALSVPFFPSFSNEMSTPPTNLSFGPCPLSTHAWSS